MNETFQLGVMISVVDGFSSMLSRYTSQMMRAKALTESMQQTMRGYRMMGIVGTGLTAVGVAGAYALVKMANSAGQLQMAMKGVQDSMKMTAGQTRALQFEVQRVGIPTQFSAIQVSQIAASIARGGIPNYKDLKNLLPIFTQFADAQAYLKGESGPQVAGLAMGMAHSYQMYSAKQLAPFLQQLNAMTLHSNEDMSQISTEWKYVAGSSRMLGMSSEQALSSIALVNRLGLGRGRGGTDLKDFLQRLVLGAQGGSQSRAAFASFDSIMGMPVNGNHSPFVTQAGKFVGWSKTIALLQQFSAREHHNANYMLPLLNEIFGQQGGLVAQLLSNKGADALYRMTTAQLAHTASIAKIQKDLNQQWLGQTKQFTTTLQDISTAFAINGGTGGLLGFLRTVNRVLASVLAFVQTHPLLDRMIGTFLTIGTAAALIVGPILMAAGAFGMLSLSFRAGALGQAISDFKTMISLLRYFGYWVSDVASLSAAWVVDFLSGIGAMLFGTDALTISVGALDIALGPLLLIILAVVAVGVAAYLVWKNWGTITHWLSEQVKHLINWFNHLNPVVKTLLTLFTPLGAIVNLFENWGKIVHTLVTGMKELAHWWSAGAGQKTFGPTQARFGTQLVQHYAKGIDHAPKAPLHHALHKLASIPAQYLELHSPAQTGPLSTLDTWWSAFVPTLVEGLTAGSGFLGSAASDIGALLLGGAGGTAAAGGGGGNVILQAGAVTIEPGAIVVRGGDPQATADQIMHLLSGRIARQVGLDLRHIMQSRTTRPIPHKP